MNAPVWRWVDKHALLLLHDESLATHGGASGVRDQGLLDSALARPLNMVAYGTPDVAELAAAYASGLVRNHAFIDGNKRAGFLAAGLFLYANGYRLACDQAAATAAVLALAASELDEASFAAWLRPHLQPR